jgi:membrane protease YdiL (CAAX protease family)
MSTQDVLWGIRGFLLGVLVFPISAGVIRSMGLGSVSGGITRLARLPMHIRVAMVFTAAITEEILFRGYPIERLVSLTGHLWLGAAMAYVVFVLVHLPWWGVGGTIQIGLWSLIVTALYVTRRNLLACMLMHLLNDAYAFILLPMFFPQYLQQP